jgi:hypothetical protein
MPRSVNFPGGDQQGERRADRGQSSPVGSGRREGEHRYGMGCINASAGEHPSTTGTLHKSYRLYEVPGANRSGSDQHTAVRAGVAPRYDAKDRSWGGQQCEAVRGTCELGLAD